MIVDTVNRDSSVVRLERCCKLFHFHHPTIRRGLFTALSLSIISLLVFSYYLSSIHLQSFMNVPKQSIYTCHSLSGVAQKNAVHDIVTNIHASSAQLRLDPKVLVFVETQYSVLGRQICEILEATRVRFKVEIAGKSLPLLKNLDKGKFATVVFENLEKYLHMNKWNRELLDKYCKEYNVGIIGFVHPSEDSLVGAQVKDWPLFIHTNLALKKYRLNPTSHVLRLTKAGQVYSGALPGADWTVFQPNHATYEPIAFAEAQSFQSFFTPEGVDSLLPTVLQDRGQYDGIQRIIFGNGFKFWLHKLLFLDSVSYLSHGKLSTPLQRYLLIDVDDIFVGEKGTRMKPSDVQALLDTQRRLQQVVSGFKFNLGFSGKFFQKGTYEENDGDDLLLKHAHEFWWFCHMWSHGQPHLFGNISSLETEMQLNKEFARSNHIPANLGYSVAPHHSGVYPVHEHLYELWKKVWNVRVTSTEEYPHLRPARLRRGFIHRNIMVLPRQTCGLYTHTIFMDKYPGGPDKLLNSICGGELFLLFVFNPINVFMTHLSNYGNDRLALYTFESVVNFVRCWTNLQLMTLPPLQLADKYFQLFPEESDPIWMNPCNDKRHLAIWSPNKSCEQLPKFLVIGPQKTGTTALYTFLSMHPAIISNYPSSETYEEVQFFNGRNYYKGLDWCVESELEEIMGRPNSGVAGREKHSEYEVQENVFDGRYMSFFPVLSNSSDKYLFEKSATYFDGELVPMRAYALLPHAKLLAILISPIRRAYSWYQHMKAHKDSASVNYSFYEVVTAGDRAPRPLKELRNRCLNPGMYAQNLERWLNYYSPQQLMIIDGEQLKTDPFAILNQVQQFLKIRPFYDYSEHLRYDSKKGFFCQITQRNGTKCLGRGKGRHYSPMDPRAEKFLKAFYLSHNVALSKLLTRLRQPIPNWLQEDLSHD